MTHFGQAVTKVDTVFDLGVILNSNINFDTRVNKVASKGSLLLGFFYRNSKDAKIISSFLKHS